MTRSNNLNRRNFLHIQTALVSTGLLLPSVSSWSQNSSLSSRQKESLMMALEKADPNFNETEKMIRGNVSGVGYHTTLKSGTVHHTRGSLQYAAGLMASGVEWRINRAKDIIKKVIALQDQNPENKTYGIWSWYLEEPLEKMSPPDWNWADFCSVQLLRIWIDQPELLEPELKKTIEDSIIHAAHSIKRRNVGPGYTNIAMMGTYVTLCVGERMNQPEIHHYGKERLRRVHQFTMDNGSFQEYNSSTYSIVAIAELTRMVMHFQDEEDRALASEMHDLAWKHLATHFHAPTQQLAGPQSRCYATDLRKRESTLAFLELATGNTNTLMQKDPLPLGIDHSFLDIHCPETYHHLFFSLAEPKVVQEIFSKAKDLGKTSLIGTTYLHPHYTLGSINTGDFWVQRRPILAYWGTKEKPVYLQVRFLHDGYDYSSAIPVTLQKENRLFTVVTFATDYGDTHISLDKIKNAAIQAKDLRLLFDIGGETENIKWIEPEEGMNEYILKSGDIQIKITPGAMFFDGKELQIKNTDDGIGKEVICFQSNEETTIHWDNLKETYLSFCIEIVADGQESSRVSITREEEFFSASWQTATMMAIKGTSLPAKRANLPQPFALVN